MQQQSSVSLTSELQSEKVQKGLSGVTYDPLSQTLFAILAPSDQNQHAPSTLVSIPDKIYSLPQEEGKLSSHSQLEQHNEQATSSFKSLSQQQSERKVFDSQAYPNGLAKFLHPYLLRDQIAEDPDESSKTPISTTDTYHEPDCLRFCPSNSSSGVEISLSGLTCLAKLQSQIARANKSFSEGVHYWEIICPISCQTLQIGVSNKSQKEEVVQQFRTTTPRVIGIELNLDKLTLSFWLNGRLIKERAKKVPPGQAWYPIVKFKESEYFVIINPFAQGRGDLAEEQNTNYLPSTLRSSEIQLLKSYLTTKLKGMLVIYGLNQEVKENSMEEIKKLLRLDGSIEYKFQDSYELLHNTEPKSEQEPDIQVITIALLRFQNYQDSVRYYQKNKDFKILYDKQLALLIQMRNSKEKVGEIPIELGTKVFELITSQVYFEDDIQSEFKIYSGLQTLTTPQEVSKKLALLKEQAISEENKEQIDENESSQLEMQIQFLESSDKMLLVNGSQLKLVSRIGGDFKLDSNSNFTGFPQTPEDKINLKVSKSDVDFLLTNLDWSQVKPDIFDMMNVFLESLIQHNSLSQAQIPITYQIAFVIVKSFLNIAINQYEYLENQLSIIQDQDITQSKNAQKRITREIRTPFNNEISLPFEYGTLSLFDCHQLLSILIKLEDQLWAATQSDQVSSSLKSLWSSGVSSTSSRIQTAFGRLSSLVTYPGTSGTVFDPLYLAEVGLVNIDDKYGKLQFYQNFRTELESIFEQKHSSQNLSDFDLRSSLSKQFPQSLLLKGYPTFNVALHETLNNMPPQVHSNQLKDLKTDQSLVDTVKTLPNSDFIMTGSKDGSMNIWNTTLRLQSVGGLNLKQKLYQENGIDQLLFLERQTQEEEQQNEQKNSCNIKLLSQKGKKIKVVSQPKVEDINQEITEDLLFTMFNEVQDPASDDVLEIDLQSDEEDHKLEIMLKYLLDYTDSPTLANTKVEKLKEEKKVVEEEKKVDPNEESKGDEKPIEPSQDLLNQMVMMGFTVEVSKLALIKSKNESLSAALDVISEVQTELDKHKKAEQFEIKIVSFECTVCTLINPEGISVCEACGAAAPQTAYIQVRNEELLKKEKELEEQKKKEQDDLLIKAQEEEQQRIIVEQQKREQEELERRKQDEMRRQTVQYYENTEIVDFVFASINDCKSNKPLLTGAVYENHINKTVEIELHSLNYRQSYLRLFIGNPGKFQCQICDVAHKNEDEANEHLFKNHSKIVECFYPTLIGTQLSQNKWNIKTNRLNQLIMRNEMLGRIVFPFEKLLYFTQVGSDISKDKPIYLIGVGNKPGQAQVSLIIERVSLNYDSNEFDFFTLSADSHLLQQGGINNEDVRQLLFCHKSNRLIVVSQVSNQQQSVSLFDIDTQDKKLHLIKVDQFSLQIDSEKIVKVENGILYVSVENKKLRRYLIDQNTIRQLSEKEKLQILQAQNQRKDTLTEDEILKMQIYPQEVNIQDIQRYEKLMNGKTVLAISNSSSDLMTTRDNQKTVYHTNHHWTINSANEHNLGPFEMQFIKPTSLISLNIELQFNIKDPIQLLELLQRNQALRDAAAQSQFQQNPSMIDTSTNTEKKSENIVNLGMLSIQGISHESLSGNQLGNSNTQISSNQAQNLGEPSLSHSNELSAYMPLVVNHYKGSSYNQSYQVSRIVTDNNFIFASNYPKPEFYFKHLHNHKMNIEKITVRSCTNSKCGAYPVGSGIVFISDNLSAFEYTLPFHKFTFQDYNDWKQQRLKDPTPLRAYEPVAYFEFDNETSTTVDIDFQRPC